MECWQRIRKGPPKKRILATTTILALTAGFAAAEVTLSGDARMGIISDFGGADTAFTSRARVSFSLSGESDSGFSFGASFRADNAGDAADGTAGSVWIEGAFGKLSMGDNDSAAQAVVGQVSGVGYTGLWDHNEISYLGDESTSALYTYSNGGLTVALSVGQQGLVDAWSRDLNEASIAASYAMDGFKVSIGYETGYDETENPDAWWVLKSWDHQTTIGADATFGAFTLKARYATADGRDYYCVCGWVDVGAAERTQMALSADYAMDALTVTAFATQSDISSALNNTVHSDRYGLGVAYDLGGGAALKAGYAHVKETGLNNWNPSRFEYSHSDWDLGLTFSF